MTLGRRAAIGCATPTAIAGIGMVPCRSRNRRTERPAGSRRRRLVRSPDGGGTMPDIAEALRHEVVEANEDDVSGDVHSDERRKTERGSAATAFTRGAAGRSMPARAVARRPRPGDAPRRHSDLFHPQTMTADRRRRNPSISSANGSPASPRKSPAASSGTRRSSNGTVTSLLAGGHVLLEGIPGVGKTSLVHTLADALHLKFSRIQFTPDLMPADIVGTNIVQEHSHGGTFFEFQPGPIFANVVLADEINRATPKTQSALLEAMQDVSVSVGKTTYPLEQPFLVLATQNPIEMEGTYPLPEAQLDRFFFKLKVTYPAEEAMHEILERTTRDSRHAR